MKPRFVVAAGGTGGHILPGIRIGEALSGDFAVDYLCGTRPIEAQVYSSQSVEPVRLAIPKLGTKLGPAGLAADHAAAFAQMSADFVARRPAGVLAMGGAVCFPTLAAAVALGIPIFLHESNAIPGRVTRMFARFARCVFAGIGGLGIPNAIVSGTPTTQPSAAAAERNLVLAVGGSQGASRLNDVFVAAANSLADLPVEWLLISGPGKSVANPGRVQVMEYAPRIGELLARCAVCVSRAGAGAIADAVNYRVPAILVPYPHAMDDHQTANARVLEEAGGAIVVSERELSPSRLAKELRWLLDSPERRAGIAARLAPFDSTRSAEAIAGAIASRLSPASLPLAQGASR